jgi:integrase/recombinase XerD
MALTFTQACAGFIHYQTAAGRSPYTLRNYRTTFAKLQTFLDADPPLASITRGQIIDFLAWLQDDYISEPDGAAPRGQIRLSAKTILNIHTDLSALWRWAVSEGFLESNIVRSIEAPNPKAPVVDTFTQRDIEAMLETCDRKRTWKARADAEFGSIADRDRAIILVLLDTGARAQELCDMQIADLDMTANRIEVVGKGEKPRYVHFGKRTSKALWKYITPRLGDNDQPLFTVGPDDDRRPLSRFVLLRLLKRIGERAGVQHVYPHRFRHTFAITYLRNGGDLFTLQELLGHSDLEMVRRYARIAATDCARVHAKASPVDNWRL